MTAKVDPDRITQIDTLERELNESAIDRLVEVKHARSMFSYHGGDNVHHPINIREAVEWSNSKRGEWQPPGAGDSCMRFGLCESSSPD